jgi:hypothetical protein
VRACVHEKQLVKNHPGPLDLALALAVTLVLISCIDR